VRRAASWLACYRTGRVSATMMEVAGNARVKDLAAYQVSAFITFQLALWRPTWYQLLGSLQWVGLSQMD
jgi:hypothetical protein